MFASFLNSKTSGGTKRYAGGGKRRSTKRKRRSTKCKRRSKRKRSGGAAACNPGCVRGKNICDVGCVPEPDGDVVMVDVATPPTPPPGPGPPSRLPDGSSLMDAQTNAINFQNALALGLPAPTAATR